jgi:cytochrome c biogenesis protein CcmG/thiol:disulfide interchange protein DsbE
MNRRVVAAGALIFLPLLVILLIGLGRDPSRIESPLIGSTAPPFVLESLNGSETVSLERLRGSPVVLNFWASWCGPCFEEHPVLLAAARAYEPRVRFLGIIYDDTIENATAYLREEGDAFPALSDPGGRMAIAYGVFGVPETFFIDASGSIMAKHQGPLSREDLEDYLRRLQEASR